MTAILTSIRAKPGDAAKPLDVMQAMQMKRFAKKAMDKPRHIDAAQWQKNVADLNKTFSVAQSLFLCLEHNNEALLRVGVELVTCKKARKILTWTDEWSYDDDRREWFREMVGDKLKKALEVYNQGAEEGEAVAGALSAMPGNSGEVRELKKRVAVLEEELQDSKTKETTWRGKATEWEVTALEGQEKIEKLEGTIDGFRDKARDAAIDNRSRVGSGAGADAALEGSSDPKHQAQVKAMQREFQEKLAQVQETLQNERQANGRLQVGSTESARVRCDSGVSCNLGGEGGGASDGRDGRRRSFDGRDDDHDHSSHGGKSSKAKEKDRGSTTTEDALRRENADLKRQLRTALAGGGAAPQAGEAGGADGSAMSGMDSARAGILNDDADDDDVMSGVASTPTKRFNSAEFTGSMDDLKQLLEEKCDECEAIENQKNVVTARLCKTSKALHEVKKRLEELQAIMEKKGFKQADVKDAIDESGIEGATEVPEALPPTCFDRLYKDAMRRIDKYLQLAEAVAVKRSTVRSEDAACGPLYATTPIANAGLSPFGLSIGTPSSSTAPYGMLSPMWSTVSPTFGDAAVFGFSPERQSLRGRQDDRPDSPSSLADGTPSPMGGSKSKRLGGRSPATTGCDGFYRGLVAHMWQGDASTCCEDTLQQSGMERRGSVGTVPLSLSSVTPPSTAPTGNKGEQWSPERRNLRPRPPDLNAMILPAPIKDPDNDIFLRSTIFSRYSSRRALGLCGTPSVNARRRDCRTPVSLSQMGPLTPQLTMSQQMQDQLTMTHSSSAPVVGLAATLPLLSNCGMAAKLCADTSGGRDGRAGRRRDSSPLKPLSPAPTAGAFVASTRMQCSDAHGLDIVWGSAVSGSVKGAEQTAV